MQNFHERRFLNPVNEVRQAHRPLDSREHELHWVVFCQSKIADHEYSRILKDQLVEGHDLLLVQQGFVRRDSIAQDKLRAVSRRTIKRRAVTSVALYEQHAPPRERAQAT